MLCHFVVGRRPLRRILARSLSFLNFFYSGNFITTVRACEGPLSSLALDECLADATRKHLGTVPSFVPQPQNVDIVAEISPSLTILDSQKRL